MIHANRPAKLKKSTPYATLSLEMARKKALSQVYLVGNNFFQAPVMRHNDQRGCACTGLLGQQPNYSLAIVVIQGTGGFICQNKLRMIDQRAGNTRTLLLADTQASR